MNTIVLSIPDLMVQVMLSKKRRVKYTKTGKISSTSGTPKYHKVAGNDLWASLNPHIRAKVLKELKLWFYNNYVRSLDPLTEFPISITFEFHGPLTDHDLDNLDIFYRKAFLDCLSGHVRQIAVKTTDISTSNKTVDWDFDGFPPKIPDDNVNYIREVVSRYVPDTSTKLVITIKTINDRDEDKKDI